MTPEFPVTVTLHEEGEVFVLNSLKELACQLEWFDSDDPEENASVTDAKGRAIRTKIEKLSVLVFELQSVGKTDAEV